MLPVILGGMALFGAGYAAKMYFDENQVEVDEKIEEWFDAKTEALNNYTASKSENKYQVEEEINLESLQQMKKRVYSESYSNFVSLYGKIDNIDLGILEVQELNFSSKIYGDELYDESIQNNIKIATNLLLKANNLLSEMNINLDEIIQQEINYENFRNKEKELLQQAFELAQFIQIVCEDDCITDDIVEKFNEIILA